MVSILVPCFNHEKYIEDCLKSLIAQDYKDIELVVYDDCSSDSSFKVLKSWEYRLTERFKKVILHKNTKNLGVVKNLNAMIEISGGEYIKIIASDDMLLPSAISDFVSAQEKSKADVIFSNVALIPETMRWEEIQVEKLSLRYSTKPKDGYNLTGTLCGRNYIAAPGAFIPRKTFDKYGKYDEAYCLEDFEFWLRVSVSGCIQYLDAVTALYRQNQNSLSRFDTSKAAIARHQKFSRDKMRIFSKYEKYASKEQAACFFNAELDSAIGTNDKEIMKEIIRTMKNKQLYITAYNRYRVLPIYLGIYPALKKIKHRMQKK